VRPVQPLQVAVAAALLAAPEVAAIVGEAVYAPHQDFDDVYPRVTLDAPQRLPSAERSPEGSELFVTIHAWAQGPEASLTCGDLADAVCEVLDGYLPVPGFATTGCGFQSAAVVGDPNPAIEHIVSVYRFVLRPLS
jgi:hypothetical protein